MSHYGNVISRILSGPSQSPPGWTERADDKDGFWVSPTLKINLTPNTACPAGLVPHVAEKGIFSTHFPSLDNSEAEMIDIRQPWLASPWLPGTDAGGDRNKFFEPKYNFKKSDFIEFGEVWWVLSLMRHGTWPAHVHLSLSVWYCQRTLNIKYWWMLKHRELKII